MATRKILFKTPEPSDYTIEYMYEHDKSMLQMTADKDTILLFSLDRFREMYSENSKKFIDFIYFEMECDFDFFRERLEDELRKTRIKCGFLEGCVSWRRCYASTDLFDVDDVDTVLEKLSIRGDYRLTVWKEGNQLGFTRHSHDEPTGVDIYLRSQKHYKAAA